MTVDGRRKVLGTKSGLQGNGPLFSSSEKGKKTGGPPWTACGKKDLI